MLILIMVLSAIVFLALGSPQVGVVVIREVVEEPLLDDASTPK